MLRSAMLLCVTAVVLACAACASRDGKVATFTRSGGLAAFDDTLVVGSDGSLVLTDKTGAVRRGAAAPEEVRRLESLVHSVEFKGLEDSYSTGGGADRMTYTISVPGRATVRTRDGSPHPAVLSQAIEEFSRLIGETR